MLPLFPKEELPARPLRLAPRRGPRWLLGLVACCPKTTHAASRLVDRAVMSEDATVRFAFSSHSEESPPVLSPLSWFPKKPSVVGSPLPIVHPRVGNLSAGCAVRRPEERPIDLLTCHSRRNGVLPIQPVVPEGSSRCPAVRCPRKGTALPGRMLSSGEVTLPEVRRLSVVRRPPCIVHATVSAQRAPAYQARPSFNHHPRAAADSFTEVTDSSQPPKWPGAYCSPLLPSPKRQVVGSPLGRVVSEETIRCQGLDAIAADPEGSASRFARRLHVQMALAMMPYRVRLSRQRPFPKTRSSW